MPAHEGHCAHRGMEAVNRVLEGNELEPVVCSEEAKSEEIGGTVRVVVGVLARAVGDISSRTDFERLCKHLLSAPVLESQWDGVANALSEQISETDVIPEDTGSGSPKSGSFNELNRSDPHAAFTIYTLLHQLIDLWPNTLRRLDDAWIPRLADFVWVEGGKGGGGVDGGVRYVAVVLLYEILSSREMALTDLGIFSEPFVDHLCSLIEDSRVSSDEDADYALVNLLVAIHHQFALKNAAVVLIPNTVLSTLSRRTYQSKTLTENFIFIFNRAEERRLRIMMTQFLAHVLASPDTRDLWYTNDFDVILDVVVREVKNVDAEDEELHQSYICILPLLFCHPNSKLSAKKGQEVHKLILEIRDGPYVRSPTRRCADRALVDNYLNC
ncbi:hypothetical protein DFS34DRAFT_394869 [Phlyctochytrium arcticum]|nr:hypothetical protein DFS34DRAFT_394869 [Phlyctochytrium arcticum]